MDEEKKVLTEEPENCMEQDSEEEFCTMLSSTVKDFTERNGTWTLSKVLGVLLYGAATDQLVKVPMRLEQDGELYPAVLVTQSGSRYIGLLSESDEKEPVTEDVPLRTVFGEVDAEENNLAGLAIDPHGADIRIPTLFFSGARFLFNAGYAEALQEEEEEEISDSDPELEGEEELELEVSCSFPLTESETARLTEIVHDLGAGATKEVVMNIGGGSSDGLERIRMVRENSEEGYYMELIMNMADYGWDEPLVLYCGDMTEENVMTVLRELCVVQKEVDKIEFVWNHFRKK